jgi:hypothetical protein
MRALAIIHPFSNTAVRFKHNEMGWGRFDFEWDIARRMPVGPDSAYRTGQSKPANVIQINAQRGF